MSVKAFDNNRKNISVNVLKLKLEQNINFLLYNHLVYIYAEETDIWQIFNKPARWDWELTLTQITVKGHNWVNLTYCDFNLYLVITKLIHKEMLDVSNHEIIQIMQFTETCIKKKLRSKPLTII